MKSNEETLSELKKELLRIGTTNREKYDLLRGKGSISSSQVCRRLKASWHDIVLEVGLKPERYLLPPEDMLEALKGEFKRLGSYTKAVYIESRNKQIFPHPRVLTKHLNMSWKEITKVCGRKDTTEFVADNVSDEELINEYKELSKNFGKPATVEELKSTTVYTYEIYRQHFGTIGELRQACGFKEKTKRSTRIITKGDCERELKAIYSKYGRLSYSELKKISTISLSTMFRKFHTTKINEIWDEVLKNNT
jgi:hypothetical protein